MIRYFIATLITLFTTVNIFGTNANDLLKEDTQRYDVTFANPNDDNLVLQKIMVEVPKIAKEVDKITSLMPRVFKTGACSDTGCELDSVKCNATYEDPLCPNGKLNPITHMCEADPIKTICPDGYKYDANQNLCYKDDIVCPNNGTFNPQKDRCEIQTSYKCNAPVVVAAAGYDFSNPKEHYVKIGNNSYSISRGWGVFVLNNAYELIDHKVFDTYANTTNADNMKEYINNIDLDRIVILATWDEPSRNVKNNTDLITAMHSVGATKSLIKNLEKRSAYALIGVKKSSDGVKISEKYVPRYGKTIYLNNFAEGYTRVLEGNTYICVKDIDCGIGHYSSIRNRCELTPIYNCKGGNQYEYKHTLSSQTNHICQMKDSVKMCPDNAPLNGDRGDNDRCERKIVDSNCPTGYHWDKSLDICAKDVVCPDGGTLNPNKDRCEKTIGDSDVCPKGDWVKIEENSKYLCIIKTNKLSSHCPDSGSYSTTHHKCIKPPVGDGYSCKDSDYSPDTTHNKCIKIPDCPGAALGYNGDYKKCTDNAKHTCPNSGFSAPYKYIYDPVLMKCTMPPKCNPPFIYDQNSDRCELKVTDSMCPSGTDIEGDNYAYSFNGSYCEKSVNCPYGGEFVGGSTDKCRKSANAIDCPDGYDDIGDKCINTPICPDGGSYSYSEGKCILPKTVADFCSNKSGYTIANDRSKCYHDYNPNVSSDVTAACGNPTGAKSGTLKLEKTNNRCIYEANLGSVSCDTAHGYLAVTASDGSTWCVRKFNKLNTDDNCPKFTYTNATGDNVSANISIYGGNIDKCIVDQIKQCPNGYSLGAVDGDMAQCQKEVTTDDNCPDGYVYNAANNRCETYTNDEISVVDANSYGACLRSQENIIKENPSNTWSIAYDKCCGCAAGVNLTIKKINDTKYHLTFKLRSDYQWINNVTLDIVLGHDKSGTITPSITSTFTKKVITLDNNKISYKFSKNILTTTWAYGRDHSGFKINFNTAVYSKLSCKTTSTYIDYADLENMPVCKGCGSNLPTSVLTQTSLSHLDGTGWHVTYNNGGTVDIEINSNKDKVYYSLSAGRESKSATVNFNGILKDKLFGADINSNKYKFFINFELTYDSLKVGGISGEGNYGAYEDYYQKTYSFDNLLCYFKSGCPDGYSVINGVCAKYINPNCNGTTFGNVSTTKDKCYQDATYMPPPSTAWTLDPNDHKYYANIICPYATSWEKWSSFGDQYAYPHEAAYSKPSDACFEIVENDDVECDSGLGYSPSPNNGYGDTACVKSPKCPSGTYNGQYWDNTYHRCKVSYTDPCGSNYSDTVKLGKCLKNWQCPSAVDNLGNAISPTSDYPNNRCYTSKINDCAGSVYTDLNADGYCYSLSVSTLDSDNASAGYADICPEGNFNASSDKCKASGGSDICSFDYSASFDGSDDDGDVCYKNASCSSSLTNSFNYIDNTLNKCVLNTASDYCNLSGYVVDWGSNKNTLVHTDPNDNGNKNICYESNIPTCSGTDASRYFDENIYTGRCAENILNSCSYPSGKYSWDANILKCKANPNCNPGLFDSSNDRCRIEVDCHDGLYTGTDNTLNRCYTKLANGNGYVPDGSNTVSGLGYNGYDSCPDGTYNKNTGFKVCDAGDDVCGDLSLDKVEDKCYKAIYCGTKDPAVNASIWDGAIHLYDKNSNKCRSKADINCQGGIGYNPKTGNLESCDIGAGYDWCIPWSYEYKNSLDSSITEQCIVSINCGGAHYNSSKDRCEYPTNEKNCPLNTDYVLNNTTHECTITDNDVLSKICRDIDNIVSINKDFDTHLTEQKDYNSTKIINSMFYSTLFHMCRSGFDENTSRNIVGNVCPDTNGENAYTTANCDNTFNAGANEDQIAACVGNSPVTNYYYFTQYRTGTDPYGTHEHYTVKNKCEIVPICNEGVYNQINNKCYLDDLSCPIGVAGQGGDFTCRGDYADKYCSPYYCNDNNKCGYAYCVNNNPNGGEPWMELTLLPDIQRISNGQCTSAKCDLVTNKNMSYCGGTENACPKGFGVYSKDGNCYKDICPEGSTVGDDGKCYIQKCPVGTTDQGDGTCK